MPKARQKPGDVTEKRFSQEFINYFINIKTALTFIYEGLSFAYSCIFQF
jgi:hypothetical protein